MRDGRTDRRTVPSVDLPAPTELPAPLPDEQQIELRELGTDLRERLAKLEVQMMAQYSAMAAYATIAKDDAENVRAEARHDADRTQSTLIGLIEVLRDEVLGAIGHIAATGLPADSEPAARLERVERELSQLGQHLETLGMMLEHSAAAQQAMAEQIATLMEDKHRRDGWLVTDGSLDNLSLR